MMEFTLLCIIVHHGIPEHDFRKAGQIKDMTGLTIKDLVSSAPRGKVLQTKVRERIPALLLKLKWVNDILSRLPSFGGNWDQYFDVVVQWDD